MAVMMEQPVITEFSAWYTDYNPHGKDGCLEFRGVNPWGAAINREFLEYKREMDARVYGYDLLERLGDGEVTHEKPDLPNVSSGETAGLVRRIARNLVQNTPNTEVISKFDDDEFVGIFIHYVLQSKVIGDSQYTNDMQQNLFASTKTSLTLGFSCAIPVLVRDASMGWYMKFDSINYRDVFPDPACKDIREAGVVYVRRYLSQNDVKALIASNAPGWDIAALRRLLKYPPPNREQQSTPFQTKKHRGSTPKGYEVITRYTSDGNPFLTYSAQELTLLRIEKNKHPQKLHPVFFLVLEKDDMQPLGKSQVELLIGRQDFQDLMLNGAMKLWYRNINPPIFGYGAMNAVPNLGPGKYTQIPNPNARLEPFEVSTQTLLQYGQISQQNLGNMVNLLGSADQQMAQTAGQGMSATPQGVDAQQRMVDITTNNYQKAIEAFFSRYCSYALTVYFHELQAVRKVELTADARQNLLGAGMPEENLNLDGTLNMDFSLLATEYFVRAVPGSLVELEDDKQLRLLNALFIPLSQAMPALVQAGDTEAVQRATAAMGFIISRQIELSGVSSAYDIKKIWEGGDANAQAQRAAQLTGIEDAITGIVSTYEAELAVHSDMLGQLQESMSQMAQNQQLLMEKLGASGNMSGTGSENTGGEVRQLQAAQ